MDDIDFACPYCRQHLVIDDSYGGQTTACPSCQKAISIPATTTSQPPPIARALPDREIDELDFSWHGELDLLKGPE